jgi:hypothetical protein
MNIRWPYTLDEIYAIANDFQCSYRLPGVVGAIDGTAVPMKKPSKEAATLMHTDVTKDMLLLSYWAW